MTGSILVLGAAGRLGFTAAKAFRDAGWNVRGLVRPGRASAVPHGVEAIEAVTRDEAVAAGRGCDLVLNAFNPVITEWQKNAMSLAYAAIAAAESNGATLLFPGSVWNFGRDMPPVLDESTPMMPTTRKGLLRMQIEQRLREAAERGMCTIILRAGDFYGAGRGSWFDLVIVKELRQGHITYPGPLDVVHQWAYLPDLAKAMVRLASIRDRFAGFECFGFPGHDITGQELVAAIERIAERKFAVKRMSWWLVRSVGRIFPMGRELGEMAYLWEVPHRIDGEKLKSAIGEISATPFPDAVSDALRQLGFP